MVPVPFGAVKTTLTVVELDTITLFIVGGFGVVITAVDAFDDTDVPPEFVAVTVNV